MDEKLIIAKTEEFVREKLEGESTGHDWWHIYRVWKNSLYIAKKEDAHLFTVELASLLHDIGDYKFHQGDETAGPKIARSFLEKFEVSENIIFHVCSIIKNMSFKGAEVKNEIKTIEGMIVQDADRLDAMGAVGIARTFAYGGYKGQEIYNPSIVPKRHKSFEDYKKNRTTTINHFYEKLLLLKDLMNTKTARDLAEERHFFMEEFLDRFYLEWKGDA